MRSTVARFGRHQKISTARAALDMSQVSHVGAIKAAEFDRSQLAVLSEGSQPRSPLKPDSRQ
jgi:hypothetical protein